MSNFKRYAQPPDLLPPPGSGSDVDYYEPPYDPFMGGGLPSPDFYGAPKQQWNAEMMDRLIDTRITLKDKDGNPMPKPKLWLFETDAFRHFQLSNLRSRDQTEMERDIVDIQMLAHQDGNEQMCEEMQQRVYAKAGNVQIAVRLADPAPGKGCMVHERFRTKDA